MPTTAAMNSKTASDVTSDSSNILPLKDFHLTFRGFSFFSFPANYRTLRKLKTFGDNYFYKNCKNK